MKKKKILSFDNLWEDICFYDTYKNIISYEKYIKHLSKKYNIEINELLIKIEIVRKIAAIKIQQHHIEEEKDDPILKTECREERIRIIIEHNSERETLEEEIFGKEPSSINIKKLTKD